MLNRVPKTVCVIVESGLHIDLFVPTCVVLMQRLQTIEMTVTRNIRCQIGCACPPAFGVYTTQKIQTTDVVSLDGLTAPVA
jgi:hypothetical protein